jgi:glycerate dehydrogenase
MLSQADVVSLHGPLLPQTQGIINAKSLALMKPSAFLINVSRGPLLIEQDLADALNNGRLAGAAVDVLSSEPPSPDNPLLHAKNCIVTRTSHGQPRKRGRGYSMRQSPTRARF